MRKKDALKKLDKQSTLLEVFGRWMGRVIAERLNQDKLDHIGYTSIFVGEGHPVENISRGIFILRDLPEGPGPSPFYPLAIIVTRPETTDGSVIQITSSAKESLSKDEYLRFIDAIEQIANEMNIRFYKKIKVV